jgi:hypothetical protein
MPAIDGMFTLQKRHGRSPSYPKFWQAMAGGLIPAHRVDGKWYVFEDDLPAIAVHFGLIPAEQAALSAPASSPALSDIATRPGAPGQPVEGKAEGLPAKPELARGRRGAPGGPPASKGGEGVGTSATRFSV